MLSFASNMKKAKENLEDSDCSDNELGDLDDDEVFLESINDEDFKIDEDGGAFMDESDNEIEEFDKVSSKASTKKSKRKNKDDIDFAGLFQESKKSLDDSGLLVSAEEFGHLLGENMGSMFGDSGTNAMANKDNAGFKQLRREAECDIRPHKEVKSIIKKKKNFKRKMKTPQKSKRQRK